MTTIKEALEEIAKAIPKVVWLPDLSEVAKKAPTINFKAHKGSADGWNFLVVGIDLPEMHGERGYIVTASRKGIIMKLPPDMAEHAGKLAEAVHEKGHI